MSKTSDFITFAKRQWGWLKWPIALGLLAYLFWTHRQDLAELRSREIRWPALVMAFALCGGSIVLTFYRWYLLVWAQDFPFKVADALRLGFIGYLFNYVAPGAAGGDIIKAGLIASEQQSRRGVAAATVLLDRLLGMLALFMVGAFAALFQEQSLLNDRYVRIIVAVLCGGSVAGLLGLAILLHPAVPRSRWLAWLIRVRRIGPIFGSLTNAIILYQNRRGIVIASVLVSIVGHFGMLSSFYFCAQALQLGNAAPGYWAHLLLIPGAELAAVALPLPGGVGVLEGAVKFCYG
ncbi:MAG: lysylphosphatidylglycerol synthase transmembrane domain-containing protein, partial [Planctomycetaceae bacterium]